MNGPDVEGVLGGHRRECADEWCAECLCGWLVPEGAEDFTAAHRAHVAAAVRAEVRAWLESEGARLAAAEGVEDYAYPGLSVIECERAAKSALAALAECVGQVTSVGEGEG